VFCLAVAVAIASCGRRGADRADSRELSKDEIYLIDAYVEVLRARSHYPHKPAVADSFFAVLDSTIDSVRIANIIRDVNQEPERWVVMFEEIERKLQELAEKREESARSRGAAGPEAGSK
jgi:hypothetical protein